MSGKTRERVGAAMEVMDERFFATTSRTWVDMMLQLVNGNRGRRRARRAWGTAGTVPHAFVGHGWNRAPRVHEASSRPVASGVEGEAELAGLAVRRVAQAGEGLIDAVVGLA